MSGQDSPVKQKKAPRLDRSLIRPLPVESNESRISESFQEKCKRQPGSHNFVNPGSKDMFDTVQAFNQRKKVIAHPFNMSQPRFNPPKKKSGFKVQNLQYEPNFYIGRSRSSLLSFPFNKQLGRTLKGGVLENMVSYKQLAVIPPLPQPSLPDIKKGHRFGEFKIYSAREKDAKSKFPCWMQKGMSSRMSLDTLTEKMLESNCHLLSNSTQSPSFYKRQSSLDSLKRFGKKSKSHLKNQESSLSDLEKDLEVYRNLSPIQIVA